MKAISMTPWTSVALVACLGCGDAGTSLEATSSEATALEGTTATVVDSFSAQGSTIEIVQVTSESGESSFLISERSPIGETLLGRMQQTNEPLTTLEIYLALVPGEPVAAELLLDQHAAEASAYGRKTTDVREIELARVEVVEKSLNTCASFADTTLDAVDGAADWGSLWVKATKSGDSTFYATGSSTSFAKQPLIAVVCNESGRNIRVSTGSAYEGQAFGWVDYVTLGNDEWWVYWAGTRSKKNVGIRVDGSSNYSYHTVGIQRINKAIIVLPI